MMKITHVALWTRDLDGAARFWAEYFGAAIGAKYESKRRAGFASRFVTLQDGPTIELMSGPWIQTDGASDEERLGWDHVAIAVGSREAVQSLAARLGAAGLLVSSPRMTGDGFYEAVLERQTALVWKSPRDTTRTSGPGEAVSLR
jgi:lactoylglutathione lyase